MISYTHLYTKIRVMLGNMLSDEDLDNLTKLDSVEDIATYLEKNTYYKDAFKGFETSNIHRSDLELVLYRSWIMDALKIGHYLKGSEKAFFRYAYRMQEVEDLKKMLRTLQSGRKLSELNRKGLFISRYSKIDFNEALAARDFSELIETLRNTKFYDILKPLIIDKDKINIFEAEMALDMYYFSRMNHQINDNMSASDREVMRKAFGYGVDFENMLLIYRGKKYYNFQNERLFTYLFPGGYKLKYQNLVELVEASSSDEVMEILKKGFYGSIIDFDSGHWGNGFYHYVSHVYRMNMRLHTGTIAPMFSYMALKHIEIVNLITIIEGIRYKLGSDNVENFVAKH